MARAGWLTASASTTSRHSFAQSSFSSSPRKPLRRSIRGWSRSCPMAGDGAGDHGSDGGTTPKRRDQPAEVHISARPFREDRVRGVDPGRCRGTGRRGCDCGLTTVKGIGRWTAEMFLMFRLHRPDILPVGDLGILTAVQRAYGMRKRPTPERLRKLGDAWKPYRSIACWYLWRSLDIGSAARARRAVTGTR